MLRKIGMFLPAAILAVGAALGTGCHALAATAHFTDCFPISSPPGFSECITVNGATNDTTTPSGENSFAFDGTVIYVIDDTNGNVVVTSTERVHTHTLSNNAGEQEFALHDSFTIFPTSTGGTCVITQDVHYTVNGMQYDTMSASGDCG